jgi:hypothetical protein
LRLWSIHPKYLDVTGLVALWRESLLAQRVLRGKTTGYRNHPQLERFKRASHPRRAIADYLTEVWRESKRRRLNFDRGRIGAGGMEEKIPVTRGQLKFEFKLLCEKLKRRDSVKYQELLSIKEVEPHMLLKAVDGGIEEWEKSRSNIK